MTTYTITYLRDGRGEPDVLHINANDVDEAISLLKQYVTHVDRIIDITH
jgi:hypothetical protein